MINTELENPIQFRDTYLGEMGERLLNPKPPDSEPLVPMMSNKMAELQQTGNPNEGHEDIGK